MNSESVKGVNKINLLKRGGKLPKLYGYND